MQPDALVARVCEQFARLPVTAAQTELSVAFSGGLDSTVLLHILAELASPLGFRLSATHVHHGLSSLADAWAQHCIAQCAALGVPLQVLQVDVPRDAGYGLEAAAREVRYRALHESSQGWIALAQHADDQAETLLHRLVRGCGVTGAAAMREQDEARRLWRPLLGARRETLLSWAQARGLSWIEDDSNVDERFTRNFLRHQILAPLSARFPEASANLLRATQHFAEAADLLQALAAEDAVQVSLGEMGSRIRFCALSVPRARNLLRYWISQAGELAPDARRLDELLNPLQGKTAMRWLHGALALCAYHDRLWLEPAVVTPPTTCAWRGETVLPWGDGELIFTQASGKGALVLDLEADALQVKTRCGSERMCLEEGRPTRLFKQLCQENGIPSWWRAQLPMLWRCDDLVWIGGVGGASCVRARAGEVGWRIEWRGPDGVTR